MIELALNTEDYGLKQVNHESGRWYEDPEANRYYSITNVLSILSEESIQKWRAKVGEEEANRISRQASGKGTEVHDMIEAFVLGDTKETKNLLALQNFKEIKPIIEDKLSKVYATEKRMFSSHLGVAGTVDCVGEWEGKTSIIDWKTSKKFKKKEWIHSYFMQAAAYAQATDPTYGLAAYQPYTADAREAAQAAGVGSGLLERRVHATRELA